MRKWIRNTGVILSAGGIGVYSVYRMVFGRNRKNPGVENEMPQGKQYDAYADIIQKNYNSALKIPYQQVFIESRDGLTLAANYYHFRDGAPLLLFFHGYHSGPLRDGSGLLLYAKKMNYNLLMVNQRAHGRSDGKTITFGIKERFDCLDWIDYANRRFGKETPIVLAGVSMGAATVLMASSLKLPDNVRGIIADCPYSAPKEILKTVMKDMKFPVHITYATVKLGAKIFGGFDVEEYSALEAVKHCSVPLLLIHGDGDDFVPCEMSRLCYEACAGQEKKLVLVKGAGHAVSYCADTPLYEKELTEFLNKIV